MLFGLQHIVTQGQGEYRTWEGDRNITNMNNKGRGKRMKV